MEQRTIGNTGVSVSVVGVGAWQMGGPEGEGTASVGHGWGGVDDNESVALIHKAQELGVNLIDTADIYGDGHSEEVVGKALEGRRDKWIIATKGGLVKTPGERGQYLDATARHIRIACEASLKRLKTDCIDFYQLHGFPTGEEIEKTMVELARLRVEGKIRFYGISTDNVDHIIGLQEFGPVDIVQLATTLFDNIHPALAYCLSQNIGTLIRTPLAWGATFAKYAKEKPEFEAGDMRAKRDPDEIQKAHQRGLNYAFLSGNTGRSPAQAALRAVIDKPGVSAVIPGTRRVDHLLDNVGAASVSPLSVEEKRLVWQLNQQHAAKAKG